MDGRGSVHKLLQKQLTEVTGKDAACWNERLFVDLILHHSSPAPKKNNSLKYQLAQDLPKMSSFIESYLNNIQGGPVLVCLGIITLLIDLDNKKTTFGFGKACQGGRTKI